MTDKCEFADGHIRAEFQGFQGALTIARPLKKNAADAAMWQAIPTAIDWLCGFGDIRVIVVSGDGGQDFCAGADIAEFETVRNDADSARSYEALNEAAFRAVRLARVPTVASIRGVCFGGGFGLAAACDIRLASDDARFAVPAGRLGLAYPVEAIADIVHAVGPQRAKDMIFSGRTMSAQQAREAGFLLAVHESGALEREVLDLVSSIVANAPLTNFATKAAIRACLSGLPDDRAEAVRLGDITFGSEDYVEGRSAFGERRKPVFTGR